MSSDGINVLSTFNGMSCGRMALTKAKIGVNNYFSSEIKSHALEFCKNVFPEDEHNTLGDVTKIDGKSLPKIDLLIGGSPCFVAGTKVITEYGYKNIEDIVVGDMVFTHKNRFRKVVQTGSSTNGTIMVSGAGTLETETTLNHPYYVKRSEHSNAEWVEAKMLSDGMMLSIPSPVSIFDEKCKYAQKTEDPEYASRLLLIDSKTRDCYERSLILENDGYDDGDVDRVIAKVLMSMHPENLKKTFDILEKDFVRDNVFEIRTSSIELALSLQLSIARAYGATSSIEPSEPFTIVGKRTYSVSFKYSNNTHKCSVSADEIFWIPFTEKRNTGNTKKVYNLEVENDNSYTANNLIVHNCQDFSQANAVRRGLDGKKSGLFYEYLRLLHECEPRYFLLENVKMKKEHEDVITEELGVSPIHINSKLVSGQLRQRSYWTNIPFKGSIKDKEIELMDVLDSGWTDRKKSRCLLESDSRPLATPVKMFHRYYATGFTTLVFKDRVHYIRCLSHYKKNFPERTALSINGFEGDLSVYEGLRYLNKKERARLQTVDEELVESLTENNAACLLGDGWTVDVIAILLEGINYADEHKEAEK